MMTIRMRERTAVDVPGEEHLEAGINKTDRKYIFNSSRTIKMCFALSIVLILQK